MTRITFEQFLKQQGHTAQTVESYRYQVQVFLDENPNADTFSFKDMTKFLTELSTRHKSTNYRNTKLAAFKRYYDYLIHAGVRNDHPCRRIFLKGSKRKNQVIHADLFSSAELALLMDREDRYADLVVRNKVVASLLIYQALTPGEIADLNVSNVDLDKGRIHAKGGRKIDHRWLELNDTQQALFEEYLSKWRPRLLRPEKPTNRLLLGKLGTPIIVDSINYLIETAKPLFADRTINPKVIRQSVIANWLNEHKIPLEQVQLMAGHKWISTTAAYRQASIEEQLEMISRFHPLK